MPRFRFVADVHIGNHKQFGGAVKAGINDRCRRILKGLEFAYDGCDRLIVLGDLFDTSNPTPQIITETKRALRRPNIPAGSHMANLLLGNHDMVSSAYGDNALGPLSNEAFIHDAPATQHYLHNGERLCLLFLPFRPEPMVDWFAEEVGNLLVDHAARELDDYRVICFHGGVRDHRTPKYLWTSPDAIDVDLLFDVMKRSGVRLALCGNWHNHRVWERDGMRVVQVGALAPTGFDNEGWDYGYVVDLPVGKTSSIHDSMVIMRVPTPRFLALTMPEVRKQKASILGYAGGVYLKVKLSAEETQEAVSEELLKQFGPVGTEDAALLGLVFASPQEDTERQEAEAAEAARTADTLEGALRQYVGAMPLPDGVDRALVETKVLNYLGRD